MSEPLTKEQEEYARDVVLIAAALVPRITAGPDGGLAIEGLSKGDVRALLGARTSLPLVLAEVDALRATLAATQEELRQARAERGEAKVEAQHQEQLRANAEFAYSYGSPFDPTGVKRGMEIIGLRKSLAARDATIQKLRSAMLGLMGIDGSPESLDQMRVGIVMQAGTAPDPGAAEAAMRCVEALAAPAGQGEMP